MAENESQIEAFMGSFSYSLSNIKALLIGGLAVIASAFLVGLPLMMGYLIKSFRAVINGEKTAPGFDGPGDIYVDGIKAIIVLLPYYIAIILSVMLVMVAYLIFMTTIPGSNDTTTLSPTMIIGLLLIVVTLLIEIVVSLVTGILMYASLAIFADTADIGRAINPLNAIRVIMKDPASYAIAYISSMIIGVLGGLACLLVITAPWASHYILTSASYIFGKYYRRTQPVVIEKPAESPSFT